VSRVHAGLLPALVPQVRQALTILAKLPGMPTRVNEDATTYLPYVPAPRGADVALLRIEAGQTRHVVADVVTDAFSGSPECEGGPLREDALAAAYWLIGSEPVTDDPEMTAAAAARWTALRALPAGEAAARVAAVRKAALECTR
jgi:hypothetical protein